MRSVAGGESPFDQSLARRLLERVASEPVPGEPPPEAEAAAKAAIALANKQKPASTTDTEGVPSTILDPIAVTKEAPNPEAAQAFVDFTLSPDGQAILESYGFRSP